DRMQQGESSRGPHVHGDRLGAEVSTQRGELVSDALERALPAHGLMCAVRTPTLRAQQSIGGRIELVLVQALDAAKARGPDVLGVGANTDDLLVLNLDFESARGLADPAKSSSSSHARVRHAFIVP